MDQTRLSLIRNLGDSDSDRWEEFDRIYRPLISNWLRRYAVQVYDADDIAQDVMTSVARRIDDFDHNGRVGAFRNWLRTITVNASQRYFQKANRSPQVAGADSSFQEMLDQLQDPGSQLSGEFNRQHDQYVLVGLLNTVSSQFQPETIKTFRLHVLEGVSASEVASRMGITPHAVYMAKSRVLHSLRKIAADWIDEMCFSK